MFIINSFTFLYQLQGVYISEIEKANDYLKLMVQQSFDSLHASDSIKEEFIAKINHIENRSYFHRKQHAMKQGAHLSGITNYSRLSHHEDRGRSSSQIRNRSGSTSVRLPHNRPPPRQFNGANTSSASMAERGAARRKEKSVDFKLTATTTSAEKKVSPVKDATAGNSVATAP